SLEHYYKVKMVYDKMLTPTDSLYASYYNNLSLLHQEMGNFEEAVKCLKTALVIIEAYGDIIKVAITCSNLAASLLRIDKQEEAEGYLNRALQIFIEDGERDFHYGAALSVMGELQLRKGCFIESQQYYERALAELDKHVGKTEYYYRTLDNLEQVKNMIVNSASDSAIEVDDSLKDNISCKNYNDNSLSKQLFEEYYYEYGAPMIQEKFPEFVHKIQAKNKKTTVYIFTWGSPDIFENEFDDLTNITIKSIPQPILEIYKSLMKNGEQ
ncbi:MAG: tetratricopeptide repeat protein, partial [Treponemataceae bacterium]|nr:tetratricopeptide repeat protein [Treponemataceae bacterium]